MYQLLPILEHLGACGASRVWIFRANLSTAREVWAQIPNPGWLDWIVWRGRHAAEAYGSRADATTLHAAESRVAVAWSNGPAEGACERIRAVVTPEDLDAIERALVAYGREKGVLV